MSEWFELDHLAGLKLTGRGARAFAQAQFTADVSSMVEELWHPLAWCDPRGRVLAVMLANAGEDGVDLVLPASQFEGVKARMPLFAIGHEVNFEGPTPVAGNIDATPDSTRLAFDQQRALSISEPAAIAEAALMRRWRLQDMTCGLAWLKPASSGRHLPQFLGLDALGAVSYRKGCYPGQEVVARLHYLGKVKHGLFGLRLDRPGMVEAGSKVTTSSGESLGELVDLLSLNRHAVGLAVLAADTAPGVEIQMIDQDARISGQVTTPEGLC